MLCPPSYSSVPAGNCLTHGSIGQKRRCTMVLLRHPCAGAIPSQKARLPAPVIFLVLHCQGTLTRVLRRVSLDSPRPFPLQKRNRKSAWKSEAGTGEGNDEFYMPLNFRSPYIHDL